MSRYNTLEDFSEYFWDYIDTDLVSQNDRYINVDFYEHIVYECFHINQKGTAPINEICKLAEGIISAYKRFRPVLQVN